MAVSCADIERLLRPGLEAMAELQARQQQLQARQPTYYKGQLVNQYVGVCIGCGNNVAPGVGIVTKDRVNDRWLVKCLACVDGKPPPASEPPGEPEAARFAGLDFGDYEEDAEVGDGDPERS